MFITLLFLGIETIDELPEVFVNNYAAYKIIQFVLSSIGLIIIGKELVYKDKDGFGVTRKILTLYIPIAVAITLYSLINFNKHDPHELAKIINSTILFSYAVFIASRSIKTYDKNGKEL